MILDPLFPFARGANAPLAGRTILQLTPARPEGDRKATLAVAEALVEAGARALVASDAGDLASEAQAIGALHVPFPASTINPVAMMVNVRKLAAVLAEEQVDLVHARSRGAAFVALGACRKTGAALVTSVQGDGPAAAPRTRFEAAVGEGTLVVASSDRAAERAAAVFPAARSRLRIVRPGLNVAALSPDAVARARVAGVRERWGVAPHERVVLAPGGIGPARGQALLVEAAALVGLDDARFVIAGEPQKAVFAREIDAAVASRGLKGVVTRVGAESDRPAAFLAAHVLVFPAREAEGVTRAAIEAAAAGALCILADVGAAGEIVLAPPRAAPEERTGWLVPPGDAPALAEAIRAALTLGASARAAIRRRSRERAAAQYSVARMTADTLAIYAEALAAAAASR